MSGRVLCRFDALEDPGSAAFVVDGPQGPLSLMVVRSGPLLRGYVNACPHIGVPLDWVPGRFLDREKRVILCSAHGASFRLDDGFCIGGPCAGKSLNPVRLVLKDGSVVLLE